MAMSYQDETQSLLPPLDRNEPKSDHHRKRAIYFVLACTLCERIAFYTLINFLFFTLQWDDRFNWNYPHSQTASYIFSGTTYISTLLFALISDALLDRAKTIIIGFGLYLFGYMMISITASGQTALCLLNHSTSGNATTAGIYDEKCASSILGALICAAIGAGAVKSNLAVFGADQIQESKISARYFDKYAAVVNIGSVLAITVLAPIQDKMVENDYFIPHLVATVILVFAGLLFISGYRYYIHVGSNESVIIKCIPILINALYTWYRDKRKRPVTENTGNSVLWQAIHDSGNSTIEGIQPIIKPKKPSSFLDFAKQAYGGRFDEKMVDDVKTLRRALVVFTLLIPYWVIYDQTTDTFPSQGRYMKRPLGKKYIVSWISLGQPGTIVIGIIILNGFIYRKFHIVRKTLTRVKRFVIGMCFASMSMFIAGIVEVSRMTECQNGSKESNLSIYVQLPQYIFIGISQLFAMIASYEYAYFGAPRSAQSLFMSLHFCSVGLSSFINTAFINVFASQEIDLDFACLKDKQWNWNFFIFFFLLGGFQLIVIIVFILCQKIFHIVTIDPGHAPDRTVMPVVLQ